MNYIVYTYETVGGSFICHAYGNLESMTNLLDHDEAEAIAAEVKAQHPAATVMVLPVEEYAWTANQFVVEETGTYEGKPDTTQLFGPFATEADAESAVTALKPGGGHEDMQNATFKVREVTAAELADLHVEALPE